MTRQGLPFCEAQYCITDITTWALEHFIYILHSVLSLWNLGCIYEIKPIVVLYMNEFMHFSHLLFCQNIDIL